MTHHVTAKRWARGWELHIPDVGVTQSHSLADADGMVRDYIALREGVEDNEAAALDIEITPEVGGGLDVLVRQAQEANREAERARDQAAEKYRRAVRGLKSSGLTGRDTARVLGISAQRVSQLLAPSVREPAAPDEGEQWGHGAAAS